LLPALPHWVWTLAISSVCGFAAWKGGPSERFGAASFYVAWLATVAVSTGAGTQWGVLAVDGVLFLVLVGLALKSDRYWPLFFAGFELLAVVTHAGRILDPTLGSWAYRSAGQIWGYLMIGALAVGTWTAWQERRQTARAPSPGEATRR